MITRRALLSSLASAPWLGAAKPKIKVGAHLWVFAAKQPGYDPTPVLPQVFQEFSKAGVDGVELMHHALLHDDSVERIQGLAMQYKLPVLGTSWSADLWMKEKQKENIAQGLKVIERLFQVGGLFIGVSVGDARRKKTPAELDTQATVLRELCGLATSKGMFTNLHNHTYEVRDDEWDLRNTMERVPEAKLGPDFAWLHRAGVDPVSFIRRNGKRMVYAHLRQELPGNHWPETMEQGVLDYQAIGRALRDVGFQGALAIELAHDRDFTPTQSYGESLRKSRKYVKRTMGW
jgi:sugar phosphate isomerase/epimerase